MSRGFFTSPPSPWGAHGDPRATPLSPLALSRRPEEGPPPLNKYAEGNLGDRVTTVPHSP